MVACNASGACHRLRALFCSRADAADRGGVRRRRHVSPLARRLEALRVPRWAAALLIVCSVALLIALVIALIIPRVSELTTGLPALAASLKEKLHVFDGLTAFWRRLTSTVGDGPKSDPVALPLPSINWVPSTIGILLPPITGFLFFLVVLLLFIAKWPDLRR